MLGTMLGSEGGVKFGQYVDLTLQIVTVQQLMQNFDSSYMAKCVSDKIMRNKTQSGSVRSD